ncbi:MAG: NAD(P)H-dependent oxidoreductase [Enterococcus sp.]|nr:NAD(P)H-dependent oxidoreductase [Enterococcus sp.]
MKKILMIVGSLRENSFNRQLAQRATELLEGKADVSFLEFADIPFMNQDLEEPVFAEIKRVRAKVADADGLWFFSPEYNHSYTGVLKNLLDWLSRPVVPGDYLSGTALAGKKAAISGVSGNSAAGYSREKLRELLPFLKLDLLKDECGIALGAESFKTDKLILSKEDEQALKNQAQKFLDFLK